MSLDPLDMLGFGYIDQAQYEAMIDDGDRPGVFKVLGNVATEVADRVGEQRVREATIEASIRKTEAAAAGAGVALAILGVVFVAASARRR